MPSNALPINRFWQQIVRDGHLTFNKKCRDLIMQIFGHEALIKEEDTADIAHCTMMDVDLYRLNAISLKQLAWRKLLNPFKWLEFLIVTPLELFNWSLPRFRMNLGKFTIQKLKKLDGNETIKRALILFPSAFLQILLVLTYPLINIAINIVTGLVRRVLAPVRYIIRPALETAKKNPYAFAMIVGLTAAIAATLTVTVLTGGLPLIAGGLFLAGSLMVKLATVGLASLALGTLLTKGFNTVRDFFSGIATAKKAGSAGQQMRGVDERNQQVDYDLTVLETNKNLEKERLDRKYQHKIPLLIKKDDDYFIYGRSATGGTSLEELHSHSRMPQIYQPLFAGTTLNKTKKVSAAKVDAEIYEDINTVYGHTPKKVGSTEKITEAFHAIDLDHTEVRAAENQDSAYTAALFTGTESLFYPKKAVAPKKEAVPVENNADINDIAFDGDELEEKLDSESRTVQQPS